MRTIGQINVKLISTEMNKNPQKHKIEFNKLQQRLRRQVGKAIADYAMIDEGDVIMACVSGGKDSYAMLDMLLSLQKTAPISFDVVAVNMDQKQPGFPAAVLPQYLTNIGVDFHVVEKDTYAIVQDKIPAGGTTCGLCSRLQQTVINAVTSRITMLLSQDS